MGTTQSESVTDSERRAILTDREREIISGDADVSDSYRYQTISRVRRRFDRLEGDLAAFRAHGDLLDDFREAACPDHADHEQEVDDAVVELAEGDEQDDSVDEQDDGPNPANPGGR